MQEAYRDDLSDFIRYGKLDAYDLTDEELARLLEVWRWSVWRQRTHPTAVDHDVIDAAQRLQSRLARERDVEVEYNTALLLKSEIEALMFVRVLLNVPRAVVYFLHPRRWLQLMRAILRARRYNRTASLQDAHGNLLGYPAAQLTAVCGRPPDLLRRRCWHPLAPYSFDERKRLDYWW